MKNIAIFGGGGFGREVKTILDKINESSPNTFEFIGFYDDGLKKGNLINGYPVLGGVKELNDYDQGELALVISIGDPVVKALIVNQIKNTSIVYPSIIDPGASISKDDVEIGKGSIICGGTIITCNIKIGDFVILNLMCSVGHDTIIKDYCAFMPSVNISGEVEIEEGVYVGTGTKIINQLIIGKNTIVGAGAVVAKSLPENCTAVGIPAKPIKFH
ncbi:acetyltransferase [Tenacibaculum retecalamus]|uniref:acetyltransferase n=1 Tax=Tenacibaculum retecalamus TaxID=3018315 RepID=UPI0023D9581D|nr:acetyltransferase [Tenacibaculum retecalamus]WBX70725.1 acetyltransferase [Tenacibaculum retecalamus]